MPVIYSTTWFAAVAPLALDVLLAEALPVALPVQRAGQAAGARRALKCVSVVGMVVEWRG